LTIEFDPNINNSLNSLDENNTYPNNINFENNAINQWFNYNEGSNS
jgi:hypothetical protein